MFRNYFLTAWRNLLRNRAYSALNILGLAAGMAIALLIGLWVHYEFSYDHSFPGYRQVYQAHIAFTRNGERQQMSSTCLPMSEALRKEIPEIEYAAHTDWMGNHGLVAGNNKVYLNGAMAEPDFLHIFQCTPVSGQLNQALARPYSIVLTRSTAKSLFGNDDPLGKTVRIDNQQDFTVSAVIEDVPSNSTFSFNYILPFDYAIQYYPWIKASVNNWNNNSFLTFVRLRPGVTYAGIGPRIRTMLDEHMPEAIAIKQLIFLQPMKDWHLYSEFNGEVESGGFIENVRLFSLIGVLVLLIACVNFMNLSTARSEKRAREVGVRKAIGSRRKDLIAQFLIESLVVTCVAAGLAVILVQLALPSFNLLTRASIVMPWARPAFWAAMAGFVLMTGLLAGSRPAFYLSSFQAVRVLKGTTVSGHALPRKILVVLQFTCSVALIICTILIYQQLQYAKDRPAGYSADRLVMTDGSPDLNRNYPALKNELLASGVVESVTQSNSYVVELWNWSQVQKWSGSLPEEHLSLGTVYVGDDYFHTMGMQLVSGRTFGGNYAVDSSYVILNEAAVKKMRLKNPVGQTITWNLSPHTIIGVVKDALMESPYDPVSATLFAYNPSEAGNITYRLSRNADQSTAITLLGRIFSKYNPSYPYLYRWVDDSYAAKFEMGVLIGRLSALFAGLAIFISCLGLFGLAAYTAEQRTREIGIRKVLGATVTQLWMLLSKDFILLVGISCAVASPLAYYFMNQWLLKYTYRITIGPGVFMAAAVTALLITVMTVSFQAIRGALANPTRSLRSE